MSWKQLRITTEESKLGRKKGKWKNPTNIHLNEVLHSGDRYSIKPQDLKLVSQL